MLRGYPSDSVNISQNRNSTNSNSSADEEISAIMATSSKSATITDAKASTRCKGLRQFQYSSSQMPLPDAVGIADPSKNGDRALTTIPTTLSPNTPSPSSPATLAEDAALYDTAFEADLALHGLLPKKCCAHRRRILAWIHIVLIMGISLSVIGLNIYTLVVPPTSN